MVLAQIISPSQSGFVPGQGISDHILMAQELVYSIDGKVKDGNLLLKLDMQKA